MSGAKRVKLVFHKDVIHLPNSDDGEEDEKYKKVMRKCWYVIPNDLAQIADLHTCIMDQFSYMLDPSLESISLTMDGFLLPPSQPIDVIKENDTIKVGVGLTRIKKKKKKNKKKNKEEEKLKKKHKKVESSSESEEEEKPTKKRKRKRKEEEEISADEHDEEEYTHKKNKKKGKEKQSDELRNIAETSNGNKELTVNNETALSQTYLQEDQNGQEYVTVIPSTEEDSTKSKKKKRRRRNKETVTDASDQQQQQSQQEEDRSTDTTAAAPTTTPTATTTTTPSTTTPTFKKNYLAKNLGFNYWNKKNWGTPPSVTGATTIVNPLASTSNTLSSSPYPTNNFSSPKLSSQPRQQISSITSQSSSPATSTQQNVPQQLNNSSSKYSQYQPLNRDPVVGDVLAYKTLEMVPDGASWTAQLSDYAEAKVIAIRTVGKRLTLTLRQLWPPVDMTEETMSDEGPYVHDVQFSLMRDVLFIRNEELTLEERQFESS